MGGGMYNSSSSPEVTGCSFLDNRAVDCGAGMENYDSSPDVTSCVFRGNKSSGGNGGAVDNSQQSDARFVNCVLYDNEGRDGGALANDSSSCTLINCTLSQNYGYITGGISNGEDSSVDAINSIMWADFGSVYEITAVPSSVTTITSSVVSGGWPGVGNIDEDPLFIDTLKGDLRLSGSASPCVDTGAMRGVALPATDVEGNPRVADGNHDGSGRVDMGAYELQPWLVHNVTKDRFYDGYHAIQDAIDDSTDGDQIEVRPETYREGVDFKGKSVRLYSSGGREVTTIDGSGQYHVVKCVRGEGAGTILEGFTITGGNANGPTSDDRRGGGMYNLQSGPTVIDCSFEYNRAMYAGGMFNLTATTTLTGCTFLGNSGGDVGGLHNHTSDSVTLTDCRFIDNTSNNLGGGMCNEAVRKLNNFK